MRRISLMVFLSLFSLVASATSFVSTWRIPEDSMSITLPLPRGFNYDFTVDWGDGNSSAVTSHDDDDITHSYTTAGDYTISIAGTIEAWSIKASPDKSKLLSVSNLGSVGWKNLKSAFNGCDNLTTVAGGDTSEVTDMSRMFANSPNVQPETGDWDVSNVTTMYRMFAGAKKANPDVRNWDVSSVTNMSAMFSSTSKAEPKTRNWDVSQVTDMSQMFHSTRRANPHVARWDVSSVTNMSRMFAHARVANPTVHHWDVSNVIHMQEMFAETKAANPQVDSWDISSARTLAYMFFRAEAADPMVRRWDVSNVIDISGMFAYSNADPDVQRWDVSNVSDMESMFKGATRANPKVRKWDTSNVRDMSSLFDGATSADPQMALWDFSNVTKLNYIIFNTAISSRNYSRLLRQLDGTLGENVPEAKDNGEVPATHINAGSVQYQPSVANARARLAARPSWVITDGGEIQ